MFQPAMVTECWNPAMSGREQSRLPRLASHQLRVREPFHVAHKVRKQEVGLRVLALALAEWMATLP
jgi:hypothetical protein